MYILLGPSIDVALYKISSKKVSGLDLFSYQYFSHPYNIGESLNSDISSFGVSFQFGLAYEFAIESRYTQGFLDIYFSNNGYC